MNRIFTHEKVGTWMAALGAVAVVSLHCLGGGFVGLESTAGADEPQATAEAAPAETEKPKKELPIYVGANRRSELEPCGCKAHQQGGIDREAKFYEDARAQGLDPLIVDAGGWLDPAINAMLRAGDPSKGENEILKTRYMLKAMRETGYDALNVAASDYLYGEERIREEAKGMALISANVRGPDQKSLPFDPFRVFEIESPDGEKIRVALIGLSGMPPGAVPRKDMDASRVDAAGANEAKSAQQAKEAAAKAAPKKSGEPAPAADAPPQKVGFAPSASGRRVVLAQNVRDAGAPDPARPRLLRADEIGEAVGGFEPTRNEEYYYLFTRSFPALDALPRQSFRSALTPDQQAVASLLARIPEPAAGDRATTDTVATSRADAPAATFFIPPGAFNTRELRSETAYDTDSAAYPASKVAPERPAKPRQTSYMDWHREAAKGDDAPAASAEKPKAAGGKWKIRDVTESDRELRDALRAAREAIAEMPTSIGYERMGEKVDVVDARAALDAVLPFVRPRADFVALLYAETRANAALAVRGAQGIDAMVTSESGSRANQIYQLEGIPTFNVGFEGRMMAKLRLMRDAAGNWKPELQMVEVMSDGAKAPKITEIIDAYKEEANKIVPQEAPPIVGPPTFIGDHACAECHGAIHESWKTTPHATAIDTLIAAKAENNPDCVSCHVTGHRDFNERGGGFHAMRTTPELANVQCEVCHGPAWEHVASMRRAAYYEKTNRPDIARKLQSVAKARLEKTPSEETCLQCHVPKTGDFDFQERLPFVNHSQPYPEERRAAHQAKQAEGGDMFEMFSKANAQPSPQAAAQPPAVPSSGEAKEHSYAEKDVKAWIEAARSKPAKAGVN